MKSNNLVAKHANKFNKAAVHRDRKNDYKRQPKHRNNDYKRQPKHRNKED